MLPGFFARISARRKTPWGALISTASLLLVVAILLPTMDVASSASIMFLFLFFVVNVTVIKVRLNMGDELSYGFLMPLFPFIPLAALVCQAVLAVWLVHMSPIAWIVAPVWVVGGIAIYNTYSRFHAVATEDEVLVLEEETPPEDGAVGRGDGGVMIPIANPTNALSLVGNTIKLCGPRSCPIQLLHMVPAPQPVSLTDAERYMTEGKEGIVEAMLYLYARFPVTTTLRYCRNIARGIVSAVREKRVSMLIMGWHGGPGHQGYRIGSTLDPVLSRAPCDIIVMKDCGNKTFRRALIPIFDGPNDRLALETAGMLVDPDGGRITTLHSRRTGDHEKAARNVKQLIDRMEFPVAAARQVALVSDIARAVVRRAELYDLVVVGLQEPFLRRFGRLSVAETVAKTSTTPLVMVQAAKGIGAITRRFI
jgi:nucleotide-binding universal stress UspA family protein